MTPTTLLIDQAQSLIPLFEQHPFGAALFILLIVVLLSRRR